MRELQAAASATLIDDLPEIPTRDAPQDISELVHFSVPVVLRGLVRHWPAVAAGIHSPAKFGAYLKLMNGGANVPVMEAPARSGGRFAYTPDLREFTFSKRSQPLAQALERIERLADQPNAPFVAVQMMPLTTALPSFALANPAPLLPPGVEPRLWVGGAVRTQTHHDPEHNLACVLAGRRRFILFPPDQVKNLYVGPRDNPPPLSLVDVEEPDFERFPRFRQALATAQVAYLEPGDAIFMPKHWWHHVTSLDPYNAMINYWWGDRPAGLEGPNECFLTALLALKDLPEPERAYWKAMFDLYVFGEVKDSLAHIPTDLQGPLGAMSPSERAALKRRLISILNKAADG